MPSSGLIALCAIVLFAPAVRSEIVIRKKTCTISGSIGLAGVTLKGLPATDKGTPPMTDENGVYAVTVDYNWAGTITPVMRGYTFQPPTREYTTTKVTTNLDNQDFMAIPQTFTITGSVNQPDVKMNGFPKEVVSDQTGRYTATVYFGWSGQVTPDKTGFRFEPVMRNYEQVAKNFADDNYKPTEVTFTISGSVGAPDVVMMGLPGNPKSDANGNYKAEVRYGTTKLKVTPTKEGHVFSPDYLEYEMVLSSYENQDYSVTITTYTISGSTGMGGVTLKGFPEPAMSDENGYYTVTVNHGWNGTVIPEKPGFTFTPASRPYAKVVANAENQNYEGTAIVLKIEGSVSGLGVVELTGFPGGPVTTDEKGVYSTKVEYGFTGTIIPVKEGYSFTPAERPYNAITTDQAKQDFKGEKITYEISGTAGMGGVTLKGLPGSVVSKPDGSYSVKVPYNWDGTVIPTKAGFMFQPAEQRYAAVQTNQTNQDYSPRIIQYAIAGKVVDKSGAPIADVTIVAGGQVQSALSDADGAFEIMVDHGWKGKLTFEKDGYTFAPNVKSFDAPVMTSVSNQTITGEVKLMTITDSIKAGSEPIQGVKVTADPGGYTAMTDATGKYVLKVPYGWMGSLSFFKPDLDITGTVDYTTPVTTDMEGTTPKGGAQPPKETRPPVQPPIEDKPPVQPPVKEDKPPVQPPVKEDKPPVQPPVKEDKPPVQPPVSPGRQALLARIEQDQKQLEQIQKQPGALSPADLQAMGTLIREINQLTALLDRGGELSTDPKSTNLPPVPENVSPKLISVLMEISRLSGTKIAIDLTVKDEPIAMGATAVQGMPVNLALQQVLTGTKKEYTFKMLPDGTYLVYHPISNTFAGSEVLTALDALSSEAEVSIIPDPNVSGKTYANFENKTLEESLDMVLAATPYVYRNVGTFYIVGDRSPTGAAFPELSETRYLRLNHQVPTKVKELLAMQYQKYVQAEAASTTDPNDQGHILVVTAPKALAGTIMDQVRQLDMARRQVLLDARVVAMERGNLLNLGVQWQFPTVSAGQFYDGDTWTKGIQMGYSADQTFTNSLMATLNMLESTSQADIVTNPQLIAQDGKQAQLRSIREEWFMMSDNQQSYLGYSRAELEKIESGTILTITPRIGDSNDITLEMAVEVSTSIAKGRDSDLPIVNRRQARNAVTVQNGGTVAVAGLTENRTTQVDQRVPVLGSLPVVGRLFRNNNNDKETREIAVFVTATLVPDIGAMSSKGTVPGGVTAGAAGVTNQTQPAGKDFTDSIRESLNRQP